ncbi:MAG: hypothetical protein ACRCY8_18165, partial [Dermatophilaceae bacterium]
MGGAVAVAALVLTGGWAVGGAASAGSVQAAANPVGVVFSQAAALVEAARSGQRVEVGSMRSETDQVFANPDGTLTREQSLEPVRVRRGASWLDVDSTLVRGPDGSWGPRVSATPMSFSGGGSAPLVSMTEHGVRLGLSWPTALPTPTAAGNELTYPEVFPGVDLRMAAEGTTFTQRLVVKTRAA